MQSNYRSTKMFVKSNIKKIIASITFGTFIALFLGSLPAVLQLLKRSDILVISENQLSKNNEIGSLPSRTPTVTPEIKFRLNSKDIFASNYNQNRDSVNVLPQNEVITIMMGGDVMLGRAVGFNITRLRSFEYPFLKIADKMKQSDLAIVNLENPIVDDCPITTDGMIFCSTPGTLEGLKLAGINVVNLANNHILNYGIQGFNNTTYRLNEIGIQHVGTNLQPAIVDIRGTKIGILGYSYFGGQPNLDPVNIDHIIQSIEDLKQNSDIVLVSMHWGEEYQAHPKSWQRIVAYKAIDAGADVIFGHHPHWIQGMEIYKEKPIFYSLGNLIFDQMWSKETREGVVIELLWWNEQVAGIYFHPIFMENLGQPSWQPVGYGNTIISRIENLSSSLENTQKELLDSVSIESNSQAK